MSRFGRRLHTIVMTSGWMLRCTSRAAFLGHADPRRFGTHRPQQAVAADTSHSEQQQEDYNDISPLLIQGGDFCGLSSYFDVTNGSLLPLPDHWIPSALKEWGQVPTAVEVLVSEDEIPPTATDVAVTPVVWNRPTATILPETGCGIDNLETMLSTVTLDLDAMEWHAAAEARSLEYRLPNGSLQVESTFCWPNEANDDERGRHRSRMLVSLRPTAPTTFVMDKKMTVTWERYFNRPDSASTLTFATQGGLDGRSVALWLGDLLKRPADWREPTGKWRSSSNEKKASSWTHLDLAGNLTLGYGMEAAGEEWVLEMGQVHPDQGYRWVVRRTYSKGLDDCRLDVYRESGEYC